MKSPNEKLSHFESKVVKEEDFINENKTQFSPDNIIPENNILQKKKTREVQTKPILHSKKILITKGFLI